MDLFQRLLGTLQRTLDYISTFTTYLLGDETHPGANESGSTSEPVPCRSHHDGEVETTPYGDISPRDNLENFKRPPSAEIIPPSKDNQESPGKASSDIQATEAILRTSKLFCKDERQKDVGQKLSEPSKFPADASKPRSSTTGSVQQRDSEGPSVTKGLQQWESEGITSVGTVQQELLEEIKDKKNWIPEKPLAGGQEHEELGRAKDDEGTLQKEGKEKKGGEQQRPGVTESDREEQQGLDGATVPDRIESGRDQQEKPEGEIETGNIPCSEPEEIISLEVQEEDPKEVAENEDVQQRELEGAEMKELQQRELETQQREQEQNERDELGTPGRTESDREEQRGLTGAPCPGRFQPEVSRMVENLRPEPDGQFAGWTNVEDNQQKALDIKAGDDGIQPMVRESAESGGVQQGGPEGELEAQSSSWWEPEEMVTLEVQEEDPKEVAKKGDGQQRGLEGAMKEPQQRELEIFVRNEGTQQREQEQNERDGQGAPGRTESDREEQRELTGVACPERFQPEVSKMVEDLQSDRQFAGWASLEDNQQAALDIEAGDEGVQPTVPDSAKSGGDQQGGPEGEVEAGSSSRWEPEEIVTLEVPKEDPKEVMEEGDGQQKELEGAEMEKPQQRELDIFVRNEEEQQREQEQNERDEQGASGRTESVREEQRGLSRAAWPGGFQAEVAKMAEDLRSEPQQQPTGWANMEDNQQEVLDIEARDEGEVEAGSSSRWEPEEMVTLEVQEVAKMAEGLRSEPDGQLIGWTNMEDNQQEVLDIKAKDEGVQPAVPDNTENGRDQQGGPEGEAEAQSNSQLEPDAQEVTDGEEFVMEEQRGDGTTWTEQQVALMVEGQLMEARRPLAEGEEMGNYQLVKPDVETGGEGAQRAMLEGAEPGGDQQGGQEEEAEEGRDLQWKPEETVTSEVMLEGDEKKEGDPLRKLEELVRNEVETEEEQEEQMGGAGLGKDQWMDLEAVVGITIHEEKVVTEVMEEPKVQGQEPRETEGTKRSLLHEPVGYKIPDDTCHLVGAEALPDKAPSLDLSAQKQRVLLHRKSSVRRAPSLKRSKPSTETPPLQQTGTEESSPPPPPPSVRPNLRHAGFGPMNPNMMAELQTRLRRPK